MLVTDRRSFKYPRIVLGEHEVEWKKSIKYLGVQLDRRLSFGEHLQIATAKAIQYGAALTRLMPKIGGPSEANRRLVASVVNSKLLYAVLGTERCGTENSLNIPNCIDECCAGPGERPANRLIVVGKEGDLSAP